MLEQTSWIIQDVILYSKFNGVVTINDIQYVSEDFKRMADPTSTKIHHIFDMSEIEKLSISIRELASKNLVSNPNNKGWLVTILKTNNLVRLLSMATSRFIPLNVSLTQNGEEALQKLKEVDPSLPFFTIPQ